MTDKEIYCEHCGTQMVLETKPLKRYNIYTGKRYISKRYRCPRAKYWFDGHDVLSWYDDDDYETSYEEKK